MQEIMSDEQLGLGSPLPNYSWPDFSWVPLPVWVGIGLEAAVLLIFVAHALVRR